MLSFLPEIPTKKNNLLRTIPKLSAEYTVKFDFKPSKFLDGYSSILHMTANGLDSGAGGRIPAVWMRGKTPDGSKSSLFVFGDVNHHWNHCFQSKPVIPRGQWTSVEISQKPEGKSSRYQVKFNDQVIGSVINNNPRSWSNVKVFILFHFSIPQPGVPSRGPYS